MTQEENKRIKDSYKKYTEMEVAFKDIVNRGMIRSYGDLWFIELPVTIDLDIACIHEIADYTNKYRQSVPSLDEVSRKRLSRFSKIANKIRNMKYLNDKEYNELITCYEIISALKEDAKVTS